MIRRKRKIKKITSRLRQKYEREEAFRYNQVGDKVKEQAEENDKGGSKAV